MEENIQVSEQVKPEKSIHELYLEKKIKKKKITLLSILIVSFLLAMTIVIMACVRVDLRPAFVVKPSYVTIYADGNQKSSFDETDKDAYQKFEQLYNEMFNVSTLTAIFTGRTGGYKIDETDSKWYTSDNENTFVTTVSEALGSNYVQLHFDKPMKLYNANGSEYKSEYRDSYNLTYQDVYFAINDVNSINEFVFYFQVKGNSGLTPERTTITTITLSANTYNFFDEFIGVKDTEEN